MIYTIIETYYMFYIFYTDPYFINLSAKEAATCANIKHSNKISDTITMKFISYKACNNA